MNWRIKVAEPIGVAPLSKTVGGVGEPLLKIGPHPRMCGPQHGASLLRRYPLKCKRYIIEERGVVASPACIVKAICSIAMTPMTMKMGMTPPRSSRHSFSATLLMLVGGRECGSFTRFVAQL